MAVMSGVEEFVIVVNLVCVVVAFAVNVWAAKVGIIRLRTVHAAIATVCIIYVFGYVWLLGWLGVFGLDAPSAEAWSSVFRGISLVAWVAVWIAPAAVSVHLSRELLRAIEQRQKGAER
jgi:hypothetical protein